MFSVLCYGQFPEYFLVYYEGNQQQCPEAVAVVSTENPLSLDYNWEIKSVVELGNNCNYSVHVASSNEAGETNSTGTFSIS